MKKNKKCGSCMYCAPEGLAKCFYGGGSVCVVDRENKACRRWILRK